MKYKSDMKYTGNQRRHKNKKTRKNVLRPTKEGKGTKFNTD